MGFPPPEPSWDWGTPVRVTNMMGRSDFPDITVDPFGTAHIVWVDTYNDWGRNHGLEDIWYCSIIGGFMPSTPQSLTGYDRGFTEGFTFNGEGLARTSQGGPIVVYAYDGSELTFDPNDLHFLWEDNHKAWEDDGDDSEYKDLYEFRVYHTSLRYIGSGPFDVVSEAGIVEGDKPIYYYPTAVSEDDDVVLLFRHQYNSGGTQRDIEMVNISLSTSGSGYDYSASNLDKLYDVGDIRNITACSATFGQVNMAGTFYGASHPDYDVGDLVMWEYDPLGFPSRWSEPEIIEEGDKITYPTNPVTYGYLRGIAPTLIMDPDDHLHAVYTKWAANYDGGFTDRHGDVVCYENNWNPGSRAYSPPAPPTDVTAEYRNVGRATDLTLNWTLSVNDPVYWERLNVEKALKKNVDKKSFNIDDDLSLSDIPSPNDVLVGDKIKESLADNSTPSLDDTADKTTDLSGASGEVEVTPPKELDVEEYWVTVSYHPPRGEAWSEEYLVGGPGSDSFNLPTAVGRDLQNYTFTVHCKDAVVVSEIVVAENFTLSSLEDYESDTAEGNIPTVFALHQSVPNPNDGSCSIAFDLPRPCNVELSVFDLAGRRIKTVVRGDMNAGSHDVTVSGLASGVYLYKIKAGDFEEAKKMVVIK